MGTTNLDNYPADGLLRLKQVLEIIPVSASAWWAGVKTGRYPAAKKLSPRVTCWKAEDIRALLNGKVAK